MPDFAYTAKSSSRQQMAGTISAASRSEPSSERAASSFYAVVDSQAGKFSLEKWQLPVQSRTGHDICRIG